MSTRYTSYIGALLLVGTACNDAAAPHNPGEVSTEVRTPDTRLMLSDPISWQAHQSMAFAAMQPKSLPSDIHSVHLYTQGRTHIREVDVVDGGFDPQPLPARAGETIFADIIGAARTQTIFNTVPARRAPTIVRTSPVAGAVSVATDAELMVVFSEPVQAAAAAVLYVEHERAEGQPIAASTSIQGVVLRLQPTSPLRHASHYTLALRMIHDLASDSLDAQLNVSFSTVGGTAPPPAGGGTGPPPNGAIVVEVRTIGDDLDADGYTVRVDQQDSVATIGINGKLTLGGWTLGGHEIRLTGLAPNCWLPVPWLHVTVRDIGAAFAPFVAFCWSRTGLPSSGLAGVWGVLRWEYYGNPERTALVMDAVAHGLYGPLTIFDSAAHTWEFAQYFEGTNQGARRFIGRGSLNDDVLSAVVDRIDNHECTFGDCAGPLHGDYKLAMYGDLLVLERIEPAPFYPPNLPERAGYTRLVLIKLEVLCLFVACE
ncbi:MAG: Ig-like domain-containing protein [Gemmatimonadota bacterium]